MEYSEIIYLVNKVEAQDSIGNDTVSSSTLTKCYAKKQSVKRNEFYDAVMNGKTPSMEFVIKRLNYGDQDEIEWNNTRYDVIRTVDPKNKFDIVLVCAKKIGIHGSSVSA